LGNTLSKILFPHRVCRVDRGQREEAIRVVGNFSEEALIRRLNVSVKCGFD
jgi:hypothetical protein